MFKKFFYIVLIIQLLDNHSSLCVSTSENLKAGLRNFSLNLGRTLLNSDSSCKNILFSPFNIYNALLLLHGGSGGVTEDELNNIVGFTYNNDSTKSAFHSSFSNLSKNILNSSKPVQLAIGTSLFIKNGLKVKPDYLKLVNDVHEGEIYVVDFAAANTSNVINMWVNNKTKGHIPHVITSPLPTDTVMILPSVFYFDAIWKYRFDKDYNSKENFTTSSGQIIQVKMMTNTKPVAYFNNTESKFEVIGLPYEGNEFTMYFVMPYSNTNVTSLIDHFTSENYSKMVSKADENNATIVYKIPSMKFGWKGDLKNDLRKMGLSSILDRADFSNMLLSDQVQVSKVLHATNICINESGTTASSVTIPILTSRSQPWSEIEITFNRPFLMFLHHRNTESLLFYGVVHKP